jgi:hypothetical protein
MVNELAECTRDYALFSFCGNVNTWAIEHETPFDNICQFVSKNSVNIFCLFKVLVRKSEGRRPLERSGRLILMWIFEKMDEVWSGSIHLRT